MDAHTFALVGCRLGAVFVLIIGLPSIVSTVISLFSYYNNHITSQPEVVWYHVALLVIYPLAFIILWRSAPRIARAMIVE